jgi:hypothetical protein
MVEIPDPRGGAAKDEARCTAAPIGDDKLGLPFTHTRNHLLLDWAGLLGTAVVWGALTVIVQTRRKIE